MQARAAGARRQVEAARLRPPYGLDPGGSMADADIIVVGAGLAGLVATAELAAAGRRVLL